MRIERFFTSKLKDPYESAGFKTVSPDGYHEYTVPESWKNDAIDVLISDVFYPESLPVLISRKEEDAVPKWLCRHDVDHQTLEFISSEKRYRYESDIRDVFDRIAGSMTYQAWHAGFFDEEEDARAFFDEIRFAMLHQYVMPEMAIMRYVGLDWAYGIARPKTLPLRQMILGSQAMKTGMFDLSPMPPAGYAIDHWGPGAGRLDHLLNIFENWQNCVSSHRGLGQNSVMVSLDVSHPDRSDFLARQRRYEQNKIAEKAGQKSIDECLTHVMEACDRTAIHGFNPKLNKDLRQAVLEARAFDIPDGAIQEAIQRAQQGEEDFATISSKTNAHIDIYDEAEEDTQLKTQMRVPDMFMEAAVTNHAYVNKDPLTQEVVGHFNALPEWEKMVDYAWATSQPSFLFTDAVADQNPMGAYYQPKATSTDGSYVFAEDTAAPMAVIDILSCRLPQGGIDTDKLVHMVQIWQLALSALTHMENLPEVTSDYRPIALNITNMAAYFTAEGLSYDSEAAQSQAAVIASLITAAAWQSSAHLAAECETFAKWKDYAKPYLSSLHNMQDGLTGGASSTRTVMPVLIKPDQIADKNLYQMAQKTWQETMRVAHQSGLYNGFVSLVSPSQLETTLLGAETVALNPATSWISFEAASHHGDEGEVYSKKLSQNVIHGLKKCGYTAAQIDDICFYVLGHASLLDAKGINHASLRERGFHQAQITAVETALRHAMDIRYVFNKWVLGEDFCIHTLGFSAEDMARTDFDMLIELGFDIDDIEDANDHACGAMTLEGAPHLNPDHYSVFDGMIPFGNCGVRAVSHTAKLDMAACVQNQISGAVGQVISLPTEAQNDDMRQLFEYAWQKGIKHIALYREGASLLHPASAILGDCGLQMTTPNTSDLSDQDDWDDVEDFAYS